MESLDFSQEEGERAARYHRPLYLVLLASTVLAAAVEVLLAWPGRREIGPLTGIGWAGAAAALLLRAIGRLLARRFAWACLALFAAALLSLAAVDESRHPVASPPSRRPAP